MSHVGQAPVAEFEFMGDVWAYGYADGATRVYDPDGDLRTTLSGEWPADMISQLLRYGAACQRIGRELGRESMARELRQLLAEGDPETTS